MAIIRKQGYRNRSTALGWNLQKTKIDLYDNTQQMPNIDCQKNAGNHKKNKKLEKKRHFVGRERLHDEKT
jgi:hypothetical protein